MDEQEKASDVTTQQDGSVPPGDGGTANSPPVNGRPANVADLVMGVNLDHDWFAANRKGNRFYVVNLSTVIAAINLQPTKSSLYFQQANDLIEKKTKWKEQFNFEYKSSHTQIFPKNSQNGQTPQTAKLFGIAATIIVAMEIAAQSLRPDYNVYDHLRILPAHFFVDRFNSERLKALAAHFAALNESERITRFGAAAADQSFDAVCLEAIEQLNGRLLAQLAEGYCVTQHTAEKFVDFVRSKFPADLHVGPVRSSGDNSSIMGLGYKNAAPDFRAPRTIPQAQLPACAKAPDSSS